jgi:phosphate transport system protein
MNEHIIRQFELELDGIRSSALQMGGLVEQQLAGALAGLVAADLDRLAKVVDGDTRVDRYEIEIDDACTQLIARRQPTASDLRMVMAVARMVTDLERCGDKAAKIARVGAKLYRGRDGAPGANGIMPQLSLLKRFGESAIAMLRRSLDALARLDAEAAEKVVHEDVELDQVFESIMRELITYMMEDSRTISRGLDIVWIAKAFERVGDHAANIAESVVYIVRGEDIRHQEGDPEGYA